jgi:hypothetical protein
MTTPKPARGHFGERCESKEKNGISPFRRYMKLQTEFATNKNQSFSLDASGGWPANWR